MRKNLPLLLLVALALPFLLSAAVPLRQQQAATAPVVSAPIENPKSTFNDGWIDVEKAVPAPPTGGRGGHLDFFDTLLWCDDFEGGSPAWTSSDLSNTGVLWHLTDTLAMGGSGLSWWCADTTCANGVGGAYDNNWFVRLKSDTLDLTGTTLPKLYFKARWKAEVKAGATAPYDMWDGWNCWISTNAGATWDTLRATIPPSPLYTGESSFAFGSIWCMGSGISAWGDTLYNRVYMPFEFDLSGYKQDSLMVSWVFCSDGGFSGCSDDSSFFGLLVDSIRIKDGAATLFSNDGTLDEMTPGGNPIAGNTWIYTDSTYGPADCNATLSATHCWRAGVADNLNCAVVSYLTPVLPVGYTHLEVHYWVLCDMPDSDGDNDNSLEDLYEWQASPDGVVWTRIGYDYGYNNGEAAPGGNSLLGWVLRKKGLMMPGPTQQVLDLKPWEGQQVYLRCLISTDCNDDGGVGYGVHIDDVTIHGIRSFEHDLSCSEVIVPFPTTLGLTRPFGYRIVNEGLSNEGTVIRSQYWVFRPDGSQQITASPAIDSTTLATGQDTVMTASNSSPWTPWTPDITGPYVVRARSNLIGTDGDRSNDTAWTPTKVPLNPDSNLAVTVRPAGEYELAYHPRLKESAYLNPRYVRYTPAADGVPGGTVSAFDISKIRVMWQWDAELPDTGAATWIEFWKAGTDTSPGTLINRVATRIDTTETVGIQNKVHWWNFDLTGKIGLQNLSGDFWVSLTAKDSIGGGPLPLPMGRTSTPAAYDGHHFVIRLDSGSVFRPSPGRYLLETTIKPYTGAAPADPDTMTVMVYNIPGWGADSARGELLRWTPSTGALFYNIYQGTSIDPATFTYIGTTTQTEAFMGVYLDSVPRMNYVVKATNLMAPGPPAFIGCNFMTAPDTIKVVPCQTVRFFVNWGCGCDQVEIRYEKAIAGYVLGPFGCLNKTLYIRKDGATETMQGWHCKLGCPPGDYKFIATCRPSGATKTFVIHVD